MKIKSLFLLLTIFLIAQQTIKADTPGDTTFVYSYDDSGNRIERIIDLTKSASVSAKSSLQEDVEIKAALSNYEVRIYPNPTKDMLRISLSNVDGEQGTIVIFSPQGRKIIEKKILNNNSKVNLSNYPPGLYILKLRVGQHVSDWKIIKD